MKTSEMSTIKIHEIAYYATRELHYGYNSRFYFSLLKKNENKNTHG